MDKDLADQVVSIAARVVASGAISANGHGNVSVRVPGAEEMYFTAGPSLRDHPASAVVRVGLDGTLLEGDLPPIQGAVVAMHTAMYADNPDVGCVLHTHSPYATAYAVARRPIGCWIEALAMFGLQDGVPVAGYGPRGSAEAIAGIRAAVTPGVPAVLLANHGVLVFHRTPDLAILVGGVVEEAAQASINAAALGGPVEIPPGLRAAALQRAMTFDSRGTAVCGLALQLVIQVPRRSAAAGRDDAKTAIVAARTSRARATGNPSRISRPARRRPVPVATVTGPAQGTPGCGPGGRRPCLRPRRDADYLVGQVLVHAPPSPVVPSSQR